MTGKQRLFMPANQVLGQALDNVSTWKLNKLEYFAKLY